MGIRKLNMCRTCKPNSIRRHLSTVDIIKIFADSGAIEHTTCADWSVHNHLQGVERLIGR